MTAQSDIVYITEEYPEAVDPTDIASAYRTGKCLYGWRCESCGEGHDPFYTNRELARIVMSNHCKSRDHRINAASPTRHK